MSDQKISVALKQFLLIEQCPAGWKELDLYLFRDEAVAFYAGQSHLAFGRVWDHLKAGFHGHSLIGRFIWANWPVSMKFRIELLSSQFEEFAEVGHDLSAAERQLIRCYSPCFNVSLNNQPAPIPHSYLPVNANLRCSRSLNKLIHQAERAVRAEEVQLWIEELK